MAPRPELEAGPCEGPALVGCHTVSKPLVAGTGSSLLALQPGRTGRSASVSAEGGPGVGAPMRASESPCPGLVMPLEVCIHGNRVLGHSTQGIFIQLEGPGVPWGPWPWPRLSRGFWESESFGGPMLAWTSTSMTQCPSTATL